MTILISILVILFANTNNLLSNVNCCTCSGNTEISMFCNSPNNTKSKASDKYIDKKLRDKFSVFRKSNTSRYLAISKPFITDFNYRFSFITLNITIQIYFTSSWLHPNSLRAPPESYCI